jgi:hypothetical protein
VVYLAIREIAIRIVLRLTAVSTFLFQRLPAPFHREFPMINRRIVSTPRSLLYLCFIKLKKMKTTTIIIASVLSLQAMFLFAGNSETKSTVLSETVSFGISVLAPVTPAEATFEEITVSDDFSFTFSELAPLAPIEADFSDVVPEKNLDLTILAPIIPAEADFTENIDDLTIIISTLAPLAPAEADFE